MEQFVVKITGIGLEIMKKYFAQPARQLFLINFQKF